MSAAPSSRPPLASRPDAPTTNRRAAADDPPAAAGPFPIDRRDAASHAAAAPDHDRTPDPTPAPAPAVVVLAGLDLALLGAREGALAVAAERLAAAHAEGRPIVAVVGSLWRDDERLAAAAGRLADPARNAQPRPRHLADLLATADAQAAQLLRIALDRLGFDARIVASAAHAKAADLRPDTYARLVAGALESAPVAILPLAAALGAQRADADALDRAALARRLAPLAHALHAGPLLSAAEPDPDTEPDTEPDAEHGNSPDTESAPAAMSETDPSAPDDAQHGPTPAPVAPCRLPSPRRVAIVGAGPHAADLWRRLAAEPEAFDVVAVAAPDAADWSPTAPPPSLRRRPLEHALAEGAVDALVVADRGPRARAALELAARRGLPTLHLNDAEAAADIAADPALSPGERFTALGPLVPALFGSIPVLETLRRFERAGERVFSVRAVLDAAASHVAAALAEERSFLEGVADAQRAAAVQPAGITNTLAGARTAHRLVALASLAFDRPLRIPPEAVRGLQTIDPHHVAAVAHAGAAVRLVATARPSRSDAHQLTLWVEPQDLAPHDPLAAADRHLGAVELTLDSGRTVVLRGGIDTPAATTHAALAALRRLAQDAPRPSVLRRGERSASAADRRKRIAHRADPRAAADRLSPLPGMHAHHAQVASADAAAS